MNELLQSVAALHLPAGEFAIFGSGPLLVRGVIDAANDIDIVCRRAAWEHAKEFGKQLHLDEYGVDVIAVDDGRITLGRSWAYGDFDIEELIETAEIIDELPFVRLEYVVAYKRIANRQKDVEHLTALEVMGYWPAADRAAK
jgi:hypothetical protein